MISVRFTIDSEGLYRGFTVEGHAGYADAGEDIICAAVSALTQNTVNSIEALTEDEFTCDVDDGYLDVAFPNRLSEGSKLLMNSLNLGLTNLVEAYGTEWLEIVTEEV